MKFKLIATVVALLCVIPVLAYAGGGNNSSNNGAIARVTCFVGDGISGVHDWSAAFSDDGEGLACVGETDIGGAKCSALLAKLQAFGMSVIAANGGPFVSEDGPFSVTTYTLSGNLGAGVAVVDFCD